MKAFYLVPLLFLAVSAGENYHPLSAKYVEEINKKRTTWVAGKNFEVEDYARVKLISSGVITGVATPDHITINPHDENEEVPESFDAREQWPNCESIKEIRDQAVESMSDRICIHSNQTKQTRISAENLNSCCNYCSFGCGAGGVPPLAWEYWSSVGIVTGGKYQLNQGCQDYSLEPCDHHVKGQYVDCSSLVENVSVPDCQNTCFSNTSLNYQTELRFGETYQKFANEKQIMLEVYKNGPIEVDFTVYDDFPNYKSGVYQPTSTVRIGGHAVKIVGWGVEKGVKYWLVANSWNEEWGDKGFFKMIKGIDSCGIESEGYAALPNA